MIEFTSLDKLLIEIEEDSKKHSRFPVRFINVCDLENWNLLLSSLVSKSSHVIRLSDYCKGKDTLPDFERARGDIDERLSRNSKLILISFSEYLRFFREGSDFLKDLVLLQRLDEWNKGTRARLYIPLYDIEGIFNKVMKGISRFQFSKSGECAEIYSLISKRGFRDREIMLKITKKHVNSKRLTGTRIDGMKEYFSFWEKEMSGGDYILISDMVDRLQEVEGKVTIRTFNNNFKVLINTIKDGNKLNVNWGTEDQWAYLIETLPSSTKSLLEGIISSSKIIFDQQYVFFRWQEYGPEEKWLIWLYFKLNSPTGYLKTVLDKTDNFDQLIDRMVDAVFDMDPEEITPDVTLERRKILENVLRQDLPINFWEKLKSVPDHLKIRYLTGLTEMEKAELIRITANCIENIDQTEHLYVVYPELKHYLSDYNYGEEEVNEYFYQYKRAKLMDQLTADVEDLALKLSENKAFLKFPSRGSVLENLQGDFYWFDSLGVEWLSMIEGLIEEEFDDIRYEIRIARCNIPSVTELNKGWKELADYREYDRLIHDNVTLYPEYLVREFECIREGIRNAVTKLGSHNTVIITSDHGSSRLSAISKGRVDPDGLEPEKYGRYARKVKNRSWNSKEFVDQDDYIVLTTHKRFNGCGYKAVELHGGATLEEILVPIIMIQKKGESQNKKIKIVEFSSLVRLNQEGEGKLTVQLNVPVDSLRLALERRIYEGIYRKGKWEFTISLARSGKYEAELNVKHEKIGKISFEVIRGIKEREIGL